VIFAVDLSPEALADWPESQPAEGVTVWMEIIEDFLGARVPMRFSSIPYRPGQSGKALNCPIELTVPGWRFSRRSWKVTGARLWSAAEGGIPLTPGEAFSPTAIRVRSGNRAVVVSYTLRCRS
jgi:hypothetical protein